jgi:hypothetical protein
MVQPFDYLVLHLQPIGQFFHNNEVRLQCPLLRQEQTFPRLRPKSAFDPQRKSQRSEYVTLPQRSLKGPACVPRIVGANL